MDTKEQYKAYKKEVGKDVLKALAFFFIGLPLILFAIAWVIIS